MTTVYIMLRDTDAGLVDVETTVTGWDGKSRAQALADRINAFVASIATPVQEEAPKLVLLG